MAVRRRRVVVERSSPHNTGDDGTRDQGAARSMRLEPDDSADEEVAQRVGASRRLLACHAQACLTGQRKRSDQSALY